MQSDLHPAIVMSAARIDALAEIEVSPASPEPQWLKLDAVLYVSALLQWGERFDAPEGAPARHRGSRFRAAACA